VELCQVVTNDVAQLRGIPTLAPEWLHQPWDTIVVLDDQLPHHVVEVRSMIPTLAWRARHNLCVRGLLTVRTAVNMAAGAIEMGEGRRKAQTLGSRGGNATVECGHGIGLEHLEGTSKRLIVEMAGFDGWRNQERGGLILKTLILDSRVVAFEDGVY